MNAARTIALEPLIDQHREWTARRPLMRARMARLAGWIRQVWCGLHGHAMLLHFEPAQLSLQCMHCGHASPGWALDTPAARGILHADPPNFRR